MRRLTFTLFATLAVLGLPGVSSADLVVLKWTGTSGAGSTGGDTITVSGTTVETLTLEVILEIGDEEIGSYFFSLEFDRDLKDELKVLAHEELSWSNPMGTRSLAPFHPGLSSSQESTASKQGQLYTFEAVTTGSGVKDTNVTIGRIVFETIPGSPFAATCSRSRRQPRSPQRG